MSPYAVPLCIGVRHVISSTVFVFGEGRPGVSQPASENPAKKDEAYETDTVGGVIARSSASDSGSPSLFFKSALVARRAWRFETTELATMLTFSHSRFFLDQSTFVNALRRVFQFDGSAVINSAPAAPSARS